MSVKKEIQGYYSCVVLCACYPILFNFAQNIEQLFNLSSIFIPLIITTSFSLFLLFVLVKLLRNPLKASLVTIVLILLFFTYGHVYYITKNSYDIGHKWLGVVYLLLFLILGVLIVRTKKNMKAPIEL